MKILVCVSHVPDTTTKIQFESDGSALNKTGVTFVINPYDEFGLSRAIGFKEEGKSVNITVLCVGGPEVEPTLRKALAIGADDAVRINTQANDPAYVAAQIASYAEGKEFDLIFTGKESIDYNGSTVPGMLAEHLLWPFVSFATKMDLQDEERAVLHREVDGGEEVVETSLPVVVSCQKGIAEWRIPNMRGIMAARKKPLAVVSPAEITPYFQTVRYNYPPPKGECVYFEPDQAGKLIETLAQKGLI
ncbi:MAG: electron transfer flavoprotein beta subunit/FixA family protein [Bacteroidetes bacterium]|nr:MAG: electron transfer flavoprotein beta subunit/FixA family protein [Bacteroidota bacterium]